MPTDRPRRTAVAIRREMSWWVRLGWMISALVAATAVWTIYGGSFVGTRIEIFGLFTTGFATDLAAGTKLEELIGKIKGPGTADGAPATPSAALPPLLPLPPVSTRHLETAIFSC